jgi:hypothetical protein
MVGRVLLRFGLLGLLLAGGSVYDGTSERVEIPQALA